MTSACELVGRWTFCEHEQGVGHGCVLSLLFQFSTHMMMRGGHAFRAVYPKAASLRVGVLGSGRPNCNGPDPAATDVRLFPLQKQKVYGSISSFFLCQLLRNQQFGAHCFTLMSQQC